MIPYGRQDIGESDIEAVVAVLKSDWLTQGPTVPRFEKAVTDYCRAQYGVAVSSATAALHIACLALEVGPGDIVWTSPNTFVASANCALYCGAKVDFVDIDPRTYNMSVEKLQAKLASAESAGCLPKVVIPVHFAGQSCEMREIGALGERYGFKIIEDASHAIGASYLGEPVGNCRYSDIVVFSFHPVKIITTAEGGMAMTKDPVLDDRLRLFRSHGITRDEGKMPFPVDGPWSYQQIELGFNYRMTDLQAALGVSQMNRLVDFCQTRRAFAHKYDEALRGLSLQLPWQHPDTQSSFHLYPILARDSKTNRHDVFEQLRSRGVGVAVHYIPVHLQPQYRKAGFKPGDFPVAEQYYAETLSLPMFSSMTQANIDHVVLALSEVLPAEKK